MSIFQVIAICFALIMLYYVGIHEKKKVLNSAEAVLWYGIWISFIVIAFYPTLLLGVADILHFARVFDLLTVMALMLLSVVVIITYVKQRKSEDLLEEVVRQQAFFEIDRQKKKK